jgi:hypothetical protein
MSELHPSESAVGLHLDRETQIAALAQRYYEEEGSPSGRSLDHWLRAERELFGQELEPHESPPADDSDPNDPAEQVMHLRQ